MHGSTPLISIIAVGFSLAYILGMLANKLKISPLVGYLLTGILIGPTTPGFTANQNLAQELSELGVMLLMFGVGLHFSLKDLMSVKSISVPGALLQMALTTSFGLLFTLIFGWDILTSLAFGLCLSVASTVVFLRTLEEKGLLETMRGKIGIGWLVVEDLTMVLVLVLLPALAQVLQQDSPDMSQIVNSFALTIGKVIAFVAIMLIIGKRVIPYLIAKSAATGSRELFTLSVLAIALGIAYSSVYIFDVSYALGAFFAGMILNESELSHRAANDTLPLRDAFAVLFFVSVGMLFDPTTLLDAPILILATLVIILFITPTIAYLLIRLLKKSRKDALTIAVSIAQIGEFSFILSSICVALGLIAPLQQNLVLAGAIISIMLNPVLFSLLEKYLQKIEVNEPQMTVPCKEDAFETFAQAPLSIDDHILVIGAGRVGLLVVEKLHKKQAKFAVIDNSLSVVNKLVEKNIQAIFGDVRNPEVLEHAQLDKARMVICAMSDPYGISSALNHIKENYPHMKIIASATYKDEKEYLLENGADVVIYGQREMARTLVLNAMHSYEQIGADRDNDQGDDDLEIEGVTVTDLVDPA